MIKGVLLLSNRNPLLPRSVITPATIEKEALAVLWAMKVFATILPISKRPVEVWADHRPLTAIARLRMDDPPNTRVARWMEVLRPLDLVIQHKPDIENKLADGLSRIKPVRVLPKHDWTEADLAIAIAEASAEDLTEMGLVRIGALWYLEDDDRLRMFVPRRFREQLIQDTHGGRFGWFTRPYPSPTSGPTCTEM